MFHNQCLHTLEQIFLREKEKDRNFGWSYLQLCSFVVFSSPNLAKSLHVPWEGTVLNLGHWGQSKGGLC